MEHVFLSSEKSCQPVVKKKKRIVRAECEGTCGGGTLGRFIPSTDPQTMGVGTEMHTEKRLSTQGVPRCKMIVRSGTLEEIQYRVTHFYGEGWRGRKSEDEQFDFNSSRNLRFLHDPSYIDSDTRWMAEI